MAKQSKTNKPASKPITAPTVSINENRFERPAVETENDSFLKKIFWGVAALALISMTWLSFGVGVNADDKFQDDYSKKLVAYYSSFGKDTSALFVKEGNMHLYGGFFDTFTGFVNKALGFQVEQLAYHDVRHFFSAVFGWLAILFAGFFAAYLAGWRAAILTVLLAWLSPHFLGHSLMNPKDIPFAAGYMIALYNMICVFDSLPRPQNRHLIGLAIGLALALATRAGGLLLFAYLGLFGAIHLIMKHGISKIFSAEIIPYLKWILPTAVVGWFLACLFWPYALQNPLKNPFIALAKFSDLEVHIRVLFEGTNVMSDKEPASYPLKWILYTLPLGVLIGFIGYLLLLYRLLKNYKPLWVSLIGFAAIFPVFYVIYKHSVLHDGWRHLTFVYLPMIICAALFWVTLEKMLDGKKYVQYGLAASLLVLSADSIDYIFQNPHLSYTYFNPTKGGIKGAYGRMETDYWGISTRQGIEWLEKTGVLNDHMDKQVIIATNFYYPAKMLVGKYGDKVKMLYIKWEKRCDAAWDYALYPTRFLDGSQLRQPDGFPPKNTVHLVEANGVPILAVLKNDGQDCYEGMEKLKKNDLDGAISSFEKEVSNVSNNELAWANLGQVLLNKNQLDSAKWAADKTLKIAPDNTQALNLLGMIAYQKRDLAAAQKQFEINVKREPSNAFAYYYLARIKTEQGDYQAALGHLQNCINQAPNFRPAIELAAQIYQKMGNTAQAQKLLESLGK